MRVIPARGKLVVLLAAFVSQLLRHSLQCRAWLARVKKA
jgi:hypothetical protein